VRSSYDARRMDALLERDRELAALDRLLDQAEAGRGHVVLIEGPAGIGKSRLLGELRERAARRLTVLAARCGELERDFSFGAVRQLLEPVEPAARPTARSPRRCS
jgi:predicted ATPase